MVPYQRRWPRWMALFALLASVITATAAAAAAAPAADIEGNTYTSPNYGYTVTWDNSWFVVGEESEAFDSLNLTNGLTYASFVGGNDFGGDPALGVASFLGSIRRDPTAQSVTLLPDTEVTGNDRAAAAYEIVFELENGTASTLIAYVEVRVLVPGESVVLFNTFVTANLFAEEWPAIRNLLEGLTIPGSSADTPDTPAGPDTPDVTDPDDSGIGEPGPVFVSGQWRVAVRSAVLNDELGDLDLQERDAAEWLVIVADVTNWSSEDGEFDADEFTIRAERDTRPVGADPESTGAVASALGVGPDEDSLQLEIAPGETERVVLVYSIPARSRGVVLQRDDDALPIADALDIALDLEALPNPVVPPDLVRGELVSSSDGRSVRVEIEGEAETFLLLGVEPPADGDCFADEAENLLDSFEGQEVLVEEDAGAPEDADQVRYVWLVNEDGTRTLINHRLIVDGLASAVSLPATARFGAWLLEGEKRAEDASAGLWAGCDGAAEDGGDTTPGDGDEPAEVETTPETDSDPDSDADADSASDESDADSAPAPNRPAPKTSPTPTPDDD